MSSSTEALDATLGSLLTLQKRLGTAASLEEFHYSVVNEINYLIPYRQAALWRAGSAKGEGEIDAISGLPILDQDVPYVQWLTLVCRHLGMRKERYPTVITASDLPTTLAQAWGEWLPEHGLWIPIALPGDQAQPVAPLLGGVVLAREQPWRGADQQILDQLRITMAPVWWSLLFRRNPWRRLRERLPNGRRMLLVLGLAGVLMIPVRQSVLAPGEVVPRAPVVIRAAIDGVVDEFYVTPNQAVVVGQALLSLDAKKLENLLAVTRNELEVARAEHRQAVQTALHSQRDNAKVALLKGRMEQRSADLQYIRQQLERTKIVAVRDGVAVFTDANDWIGRPVTIGERMMTLADPQQVALEIHLPIADAIALPPGSEIELYPVAEPDLSYAAQLRYFSYRAELTTEEVLAYRLKADFKEKTLPRLGLRGTAKIHGQRVSLFYYLMRRPLAVMRRLIGY
ncbi:MAG: HlyD family efflux transporter periplasmic adaptor subunit [Magnetococcales bacterium]|nr:HlyD family efflux transporter periplasmic adaptor subunit [Magnetococcales bacterium]